MKEGERGKWRGELGDYGTTDHRITGGRKAEAGEGKERNSLKPNV
jgi:hypothetical protein